MKYDLIWRHNRGSGSYCFGLSNSRGCYDPLGEGAFIALSNADFYFEHPYNIKIPEWEEV